MPRRWTKAWIAFIVALLALVPVYSPLLAAVAAKTPMETIKGPIDEVEAVLNDPAYKAPSQRQAQRDKIWQIASPLFDFETISQRTVGAEWSKFTPEQKQRFVKAFTQFLGGVYLDKIQSEYQNEKVVYLNELVRGNQALVRTRMVRPNLEIPIDYRMHLLGDQWRIYDVLVENGVSLISNYRVQFQSILKDHSPDYLIELIEKKLVQPQQG